jgi:MFS family permease
MFRRKTQPEYDELAPHDEATDPGEPTTAYPAGRETARERYGGLTFASAFFGWLVAVALTVLLAGIIGAAAAGTGATLSITPSEAQDEVGAIGVASAGALLAVLLVAYFAGGYVAGRMSRFDGGRQGLGVWVLGLVVTILVGVLGAVFGQQYNVFERVDLASVPVPTDSVTTGGVLALLIVLVGTLLAAMFGGKAGQRYHTKIDRATL